MAKSASGVVGGLRPREAGQILGLSAATLQRWRTLNEGPPFTKLGTHVVLYDRVQLMMWLASRPRGGSRPGMALHVGSQVVA